MDETRLSASEGVRFLPDDPSGVGVLVLAGSSGRIDTAPLPFVPLDRRRAPATHPPEFRELYAASRAAHPDHAVAAAIPVERIREVLVVAGGDDRVWDSVDHARRIAGRRDQAGLPTTVVEHTTAGHRAVLPGEQAPTAGLDIARGGSAEADARLGAMAWPALVQLVRP